MNSLQQMISQLRKITEFEDRIYPVIPPIEIDSSIEGEWPICVWSRQGGISISELGAAGPRLPAIQIEIFSNSYEEIENLMNKVILFIKPVASPDPPTDTYDDDLRVYRQTILVTLDQNG